MDQGCEREAMEAGPRLRMPVRRRRCVGQSLVELALILPLILVLIIGTMELAWALMKNSSLAHATREGIRLASINRSTRAQIQSRVIDNAYGVNLSAGDVQITTDPEDTRFPGRPQSVTIITTHVHQFLLLPIIGIDSLSLKSEQSALVVTYPGAASTNF